MNKEFYHTFTILNNRLQLSSGICLADFEMKGVVEMLDHNIHDESLVRFGGIEVPSVLNVGDGIERYVGVKISCTVTVPPKPQYTLVIY